MTSFSIVIWRLIEPLLIAFAMKVEKALFDIALQYVTEAANNPNLTNQQKREWVAYQIQRHDFGTGNKYADSLVNLAIEVAVQHLKKHPASQPAQAPAK